MAVLISGNKQLLGKIHGSARLVEQIQARLFDVNPASQRDQRGIEKAPGEHIGKGRTSMSLPARFGAASGGRWRPFSCLCADRSEVSNYEGVRIPEWPCRRRLR